jgi:hypothetical protein
MMAMALAKSLEEGRGRLIKQIAKRSSPCSQMLNSSLWPSKTEMSRFSAAIVANGNLTTVIAQALRLRTEHFIKILRYLSRRRSRD